MPCNVGGFGLKAGLILDVLDMFEALDVFLEVILDCVGDVSEEANIENKSVFEKMEEGNNLMRRLARSENSVYDVPRPQPRKPRTIKSVVKTAQCTSPAWETENMLLSCVTALQDSNILDRAFLRRGMILEAACRKATKLVRRSVRPESATTRGVFALSILSSRQPRSEFTISYTIALTCGYGAFCLLTSISS